MSDQYEYCPYEGDYVPVVTAEPKEAPIKNKAAVGQSKKASAIEIGTSIFFGYIISTLGNIFILPQFGYDVTVADSFGISIAFTFLSVARSYAFRRIFNFLHVKGDLR